MSRARDPLGRAWERLGAHRHGWVAEPLVDDASFVLRPMFGCLACYLHGRLMLVLADRRLPWRGVLVPTAHETHAALRRELASLRVHPVLGKWLWLPESAADFEDAARRLADLAAMDDPRLGVEPRPRRSRPARAAARPRGARASQTTPAARSRSSSSRPRPSNVP